MNSFNDLPVIPPERADDLHHLQWADSCDLVLFMAGNQFMVMPELIAAFQGRHPNVRKIFYETLPPRLELRQILAEGAMFHGKPINAYPDVYASVNLSSMKTLEARGHIRPADYHLYLHNRLTLMVPAGNPAGIENIADLGGDMVRISQPDPAGEDIANHIMTMYHAAGGAPLVERIMKTKRAEGTTIFTVVHHRETPLRIAKRTVDVGPVWATEALHAATTGLAFDTIDPGPQLDQRDNISYYICQTTHAPHADNAARFIEFILSDEAQSIYRQYGFVGIG
jgi:molybdate transport system substrate-binding protein